MRLLPLSAALLLAVGLTASAVAPAQAAPTDPHGDTRVTALDLGISGRGDSTTAVSGNGGSVRLVAGFRARYLPPAPSRPRIRLQRRIDGAWTTVKAAISVDVDRDVPIVVRTAPYRTTRTKERVLYRIVSRPYRNRSGAVVNTAVSDPVSVVYENQARYTGFRKELWNAVRPYCPNTAVRESVLEGDVVGLYTTGNLLVRVDPAVRGYTAVDRRSVALHECAHERQWLNYGASGAGYRAMEADAARIYTDDRNPTGEDPGYPDEPGLEFDPVEHAADCAADAVDPGGYYGYGGYCNADELAAGRRLMQGERY